MQTDGDKEREETEYQADKMAEEDSVSSADMEGQQNDDPVHPSKVEPVSQAEALDDKYVPELEITHLKNPENNRVFEANADLMKRRDLVPCDKDGKKVYDHRIL